MHACILLLVDLLIHYFVRSYPFVHTFMRAFISSSLMIRPCVIHHSLFACLLASLVVSPSSAPLSSQELEARRRGLDLAAALSNALGSNVFNLLVALGLPWFLSSVSASLLGYGPPP